MKRFWIRFFAGTDNDPRPMTFPIAFEWWCTGYRDSLQPECVICALIDATDENAAQVIIKSDSHWPEAVFDSVQEKEPGWRPDEDRFPRKTEEEYFGTP